MIKFPPGGPSAPSWTDSAPEERAELLGLVPSSPRHGEPLIYQGDRERSEVYLLRSVPGQRLTACVKVTAYLESGGAAILGIRVSGDVVGELAALRKKPRSAMVTACSPMLVHVIRAEAFTDFLDRHPAAWNALARMIADQLDWANRQKNRLRPVQRARTGRDVLVELSGRHGVDRGTESRTWESILPMRRSPISSGPEKTPSSRPSDASRSLT